MTCWAVLPTHPKGLITLVRRTSIKIAAGAAGLLLAGGVTAAAVDAPEQASNGLSTAEEHSGVDVPVGADGDHPTADDHPTGDDEGTEEVEAAEPEDAGGPSDNHGAEVSAVATSDATEGVEHGEAVSEVARAGHGDAGDDEGVDDDEDADEVGESHRADDADVAGDDAGEHDDEPSEP